MVFVFWELVGICSYFLIGFYIERKSASTAANKAFIVNRVGDFGMIIGLMALWSQPGHVLRSATSTRRRRQRRSRASSARCARRRNDYQLVAPDGMVASGRRDEIARCRADRRRRSRRRRRSPSATIGRTWGYWLLVVAGAGHLLRLRRQKRAVPAARRGLPDAMEGPTPVSALVHSATMVAAGVYLVGRFYPIFAPEVLLVIAIIGCITLFLAATIAITAVDIKRVLAYSTVSQLGYMMLALGVGGWVAGLFHLITHAFFKSLLFMCSGSVIHAVHTNDMRQMGGLRKKMPFTAYTMLVGCLAIVGRRHSVRDRLQRLPLEGRDRRAGAVSSRTTIRRHSRVCSCVAAGRRGDHGVLHVPPVVS